MVTKANNRLSTVIGGEAPTNGAESAIVAGAPYTVEVTIQGVADILFHRWNNEAVAAKASAAKNSKAKKSDDIESYVYRVVEGDPQSNLAIPGEYLRQSIIAAAKFRQDPRSPRKSACDLFKAAVVSLTALADTGTKTPDYIDRRRVVVQRNAITRERPALRSGWRAEFQLMVNLPEYVEPSYLNEVVQSAGRLIGMGDFRPSYGRYQVVGFNVIES